MASSSDRRDDGPTPLALARARLAVASGKQKLDLIFSAPDPRAFVRGLPAEDLYFAVREVGLADAADVVGLASPAQFRAFVDLDAWSHDRLDGARVLAWLRLAREGAPTPAEFRLLRLGLDLDLLVLVLKTQTSIHALEEEPDPVLTSDNWVRSAEGKYLIEITATGDDGATARQLIEDFIDENPFEATRLFEAVRWELESELEESCLRWRQGRVRDLGFPALEEALAIWRPLPDGWRPREVAPDAGRVSGVPALLLAGRTRALFLDRVAEELPDEARGAFNEGLVYLLNCALVADGIDPKDLDLARSSLAAARDTLSLGLELSSGGEPGRALAVLVSTPPVELFRVAVTRLLDVQREADRAARPLLFGSGAQVALDTPDAETLAGLRRKRLRLFEGADWRPLRDRADLDRAVETIARARQAAAVLAGIGIDPARASELAEQAGRAPTAISASQLALTAAVRTTLELTALGPLTAEDLKEVGRLFDGEKLSGSARAGLERFFDERAPAATPVTREWVARLEAELGPPLARGGLDARFVEVILVAPGSYP